LIELNDFERALSEQDEQRRLAALENLHGRVLRKALKIQDGIDALLRAVGTEQSPDVQYQLWQLLAEGPPDDRLRDLSERTLSQKSAVGRGRAAGYLYRNYPATHNWLASAFLDDDNADVAFIASLALLPGDPAGAVRMWINMLDQGVSHGVGETIIELIGNHGDMEVHKELLARDRAAGGRTVWGMMAGRVADFHRLEFLDGERPPIDHGRKGYWIVCDRCQWEHGVRMGYAGEKVRCLKCGQIFIVPAPEVPGT
jgi:hypothetical protein